MLSNAIIIQPVTDPFNVDLYSNLKLTCDIMGWSYHYLKRQKLPFRYKEYYIQKQTVQKIK